MSNFGIEKLLWQAFQNPADAGAFREQPADDWECGRLPDVIGSWLESETEHGDGDTLE